MSKGAGTMEHDFLSLGDTGDGRGFIPTSTAEHGENEAVRRRASLI